MGRWAERAAQLTAETSGKADEQPQPQPIGANGAIGTGGLPAAVTNGLMRMRTLSAPRRLLSPENWAGVVVDAETLLMEGWAGQALRLGWQPVEVFGVSDSYDGLAVWLNGHKLVLLDERGAIAINGIGGKTRFYFDRRDPAGAGMLWDWAR